VYVLRDCGEGKLICAPHGPRNRSRPKPQDAFEMSKQHLDRLAMTARSLESLGLGQGTSNVASIPPPAAATYRAFHLER
jgi:hypothetical protein